MRRAYLAKARGQSVGFLRLIDEAAQQFMVAGQPLDVARVERARRSADQDAEATTRQTAGATLV